MTDHDDMRIAITLDGRHCALFPHDLADLLHLPVHTVIHTLSTLLDRAGSMSTTNGGKRGTIGGDGASRQSVTNARDSHDLHTSAFVPGVGEGGLGEEEEANALARHLAERLDDPGSVCFFERVVAAVPRDLIHLALERAMAVPSHHIRRSRAAFFTTLVKPHLERAER